MAIEEKNMYSAPEVAVLELTSEGVICSSVTLDSVTLAGEENW